MDFRLEKGIHYGFLEPQGLCGDADILSIAGAAKDLADANSAKHVMLMEHVALSQKLHKTSRVILMNHTDCSAYGGSAAFPDVQSERRVHEKDLKEAEVVLRKAFPGLHVESYLAVLQENGDIDFQRV
jgi:hypothetical protein